MSVKFQDYYETLGVARTATTDEIRSAYRKLARQYHPDINKKPEAEAKFKQINEANEVLSDPEKRSKYDRLGEHWQNGQEFTPPPGWENFRVHVGQGGGRNQGGFAFRPGQGGFSDFFEMFFGEGGGGRAGFEDMLNQGRRGHARRSDRMDDEDDQSHPAINTAELTLPLADLFQDGAHSVQLRDPNTGQVRKLEVKIPPGVTDGSTIRLSGAMGAGGQGDLHLKIHIAGNDRFEVHGHDLHTEVKLTPWEAALGAEVEVPLVRDKVTLTVPAGAGSGQRLRLKGKGLPQGGGKHGDVLVRLMIAVPKTLSEEERKLLEQWKQMSTFNPRT